MGVYTKVCFVYILVSGNCTGNPENNGNMTNQFLNYLYSKISKSTIENGEKSNQNFERADRIIIWIVGFSIGIFVILFTKDYDVKNPNYETITELSLLVRASRSYPQSKKTKSHPSYDRLARSRAIALAMENSNSIKTSLLFFCYENKKSSPSPDGSGILVWRGSPSKI